MIGSLPLRSSYRAFSRRDCATCYRGRSGRSLYSTIYGVTSFRSAPAAVSAAACRDVIHGIRHSEGTL